LGANAQAADIDAVGIVALGAGAAAAEYLPGELNGAVLVRGEYEATTAVSLTGTLTLSFPDAIARNTMKENKTLFRKLGNCAWKLTIGGALAAAAGSKVVLVDADGEEFIMSALQLSKKVCWVVTGAINLGADAHIIGGMTSEAAITSGAGASTGTLYSDGNVSLGAGATSGKVTVSPTSTVTLGANARPQVFSMPSYDELADRVEELEGLTTTACNTATGYGKIPGMFISLCAEVADEVAEENPRE
jgi:hypothetical protein